MQATTSNLTTEKTQAQKSADEFTTLMEESFGAEATEEINAHYEQKEPGCTTGQASARP